MIQWYVKELSKMTQVSVQTLHHYDHIGLLEPSIRLANGYRLYSEKDLLRLQQIIALKYFGFGLAQIKELLQSDVSMIEHFEAQSKFLESKANSILEASNALKNVVADCKRDNSIPWESIIKLIEIYRMTQNIENTWVKEIFSADELKDYAAFESEANARTNAERKAKFEKNWFNLVDEINKNINQDPASEIGFALGKRCMDLVNSLYGKKYAHLRTIMFEKGFSAGKGLDGVGLTPQAVTWLDQAMDTYWHQRIASILEQVETLSLQEIGMQWNALLDEMFGDDSMRKMEFMKVVLDDKKVSENAKSWLRSFVEG